MADFPAVVKLLRPFGDAVEEAGFECEIRIRADGSDTDRLTYRTGSFAAQSLADDPMCPDDREDG